MKSLQLTDALSNLRSRGSRNMVSLFEFGILARLYGSGGSKEMLDIYEEFSGLVTNSAVGQAMQRFIRDGLLTQVASSSGDSRRKAVRLTPDGKAAVRRILEQFKELS